MKVNGVDWPRCARCGKPVDEVRWYDDKMTGERVVQAVCHGEVETVRFDFHRLSASCRDELGFSFGDAFVARQLPERTEAPEPLGAGASVAGLLGR